jgi:hypothetical protein
MWLYMKYIVKNYSDRILLARLCTFINLLFVHLLIYYLSGYFRMGVNFALFSQTYREN